MTKLDSLIRKRIGIPENEIITFEKLDQVLEKMAKTIPFENLCIIANQTKAITKENLLNKFVIKNEGGLCYELNSILYWFLVENGFNVSLVRGAIYDKLKQCWIVTGNTHVTNIIKHNEESYLVDTGFGGNLPLKPVPLTGETIISDTGEFQINKETSEHGDYILRMKLKYKDEDWQIGYAFDSKKLVGSISELNKVQEIILKHPESPFNKNPIISRITEDGNITLTNTSFTEWNKGKVRKEEMDEKKFNEIAKEYFGIKIY